MIVQVVLMNHDILLGEENTEIIKMIEFVKPKSQIKDAIRHQGGQKLFFRTEDGIYDEKGLLEFDEGLTFVSKIFSTITSGIFVIGEKEGVR